MGSGADMTQVIPHGLSVHALTHYVSFPVSLLLHLCAVFLYPSLISSFSFHFVLVRLSFSLNVHTSNFSPAVPLSIHVSVSI